MFPCLNSAPHKVQIGEMLLTKYAYAIVLGEFSPSWILDSHSHPNAESPFTCQRQNLHSCLTKLIETRYLDS